jgi:hypothetical protein
MQQPQRERERERRWKRRCLVHASLSVFGIVVAVVVVVLKKLFYKKYF